MVWVLFGVKGGGGWQGALRKLSRFNNFETFVAVIYLESNDTFDFYYNFNRGEGLHVHPEFPFPSNPASTLDTH